MSEAIHIRPEALFRGLLRPVLVSAVFFMLLTGLGYPLLTTGIAQMLFPDQARGSLVERGGSVIGSSLIGQDFTQPRYFHPRPSATLGSDPANPVVQPYNAALSGASNLGPTSRKLIEQVEARARVYRETNGLPAGAPVPVDAVTASGSGLDPEISPANARLQAARIARVRGIPEPQVQSLIDRQTIRRQLGLLGEPRVNVLELNFALDALMTARHAAK